MQFLCICLYVCLVHAAGASSAPLAGQQTQSTNQAPRTRRSKLLNRGQPRRCQTPSARRSLSDFNDLVNWIKAGKPPVQCSYNPTNSTKVRQSLEKDVAYPTTYVIPVDDGYVYEWSDVFSKEVDVLIRMKKNSSQSTRPATKEQFQNVFVPETGVNMLAQVTEDFGKAPIHGVEGFYGYDHFDGDYQSPTGTNAEEDLMFNVTMIATIMDVVGRLFPQRLKAACVADGYLDYSFSSHVLGGDGIVPGYTMPRNRQIHPTHTVYSQLLNARRNRPTLHSRLQSDRYPQHLSIGKSFLMPYVGGDPREERSEAQAESSPAPNRNINRPLGDDKIFNSRGRAFRKIYRAIELVF